MLTIPADRWPRWLAGFSERHGAATLSDADDGLRGDAPDGSWFVAQAPFGRAELDLEPPADWGVLLVRKGGFAVARLAGSQVTASKVGQRHVQGRTKAGGQSQQRFSRRRDNQARVAFEAAADHAANIFAGLREPGGIVVGGDKTGIAVVLADRRLAGLTVWPPFLDVPDPRRAVLEQAVIDAGSVRVKVHNAEA